MQANQLLTKTADQVLIAIERGTALFCRYTVGSTFLVSQILGAAASL